MTQTTTRRRFHGRALGVTGSALASLFLGGVLATGCVVTDDPAGGGTGGTVLARVTVGNARPNLMLLVDTSGSMPDPVDPTDPDCKVGGVLCGSSRPCDTSVCPTRWSELQAAMQDFLSSSGTVARMGLATFPDLSVDPSCGATASLSVNLPPVDRDDDDTLLANAEQVKNRLLAIKNSSTTGEQTPRGGTPTSLSLQFIGSRPELQTASRQDFVLLLTDGMPNCNAGFQPAYPDSGCFCTLTDCTYAKQIGCLDKNASVAAVQALRAKDIKTIVLGFGSDFNASSASGSQGVATLNTMAEAGGVARACTQNADCGTGDTCDTTRGLCTRRFFRAGNGAELVAALQSVGEKLKPSCVFPLDSMGTFPQESLDVSLDGQVLAPGADTWTLNSEGVRFTGSACQRIQAALPTAPVLVEVVKAR